MAELPVSGEQFFRDFSFDVMELKVERHGATVSTVRGLTNDDERGRYIGMLYGCDIQQGDILLAGFSSYRVSRVEIDTYHGSPSLVKAYY